MSLVADFSRQTDRDSISGRISCFGKSNMATPIKLLDVVAFTGDLPDKNLVRGQVGTVVEILGPEVYEVEFCDDAGCTYVSAALQASQLMVLHYQPQIAA